MTSGQRDGSSGDAPWDGSAETPQPDEHTPLTESPTTESTPLKPIPDLPPPAAIDPEEEGEEQLPADADPLLRIQQERESEEIRELRETGRAAMHLLAQLLRNFQLYNADNVIFERPLAEFDRVLRLLIGRLGEVRLVVVEGQPYVGDLRIRVDSASVSNVAFLDQWLRDRGLGGWCFTPPPSFDALQAFLALVARTRFGKEGRLERARTWLGQTGFTWMEPIPPQRFREEGEEYFDSAANPRATQVFEHGVSAIRGFFGMLGKTGVGPVLDARKAVQYMVDLAIEDQPNTLALGLMAELGDPLLSHSMHVANLSVAIGRTLGVPRHLLAELGLCGLLHDTGFGDLPPDMGQNSELDSELSRIMDHSVLGFRMQIRQRGYHIGRLFRAVVNLEHHLEIAGTRQQAWDDPNRPIHPFSRIVAVAEAYDTMLTDTASRTAMLPTQAIREVWRGRGTRFDAVVVQALVNIMGLYPFGSVLQLSDGSIAVAVAQGVSPDSFDRPEVRVLRAGERLLHNETYDLSGITESSIHVQDVLDPRSMGIDLLDALFDKGDTPNP